MDFINIICILQQADCNNIFIFLEGKVVLDRIGFEVEAYYASEIDEDAMLVSMVNHADSIEYLGDVRKLSNEKVCFLFYLWNK